MNSTDLENLYTKIDGHISLVGSYTKNPTYLKIIKSCRLKPYSIFTGDFKAGTRFEKHWVDEFGNSLKFDNNPKILSNDTQLIDNTKISTDLFFGASPNATAKNSKAVFIAGGLFFGKDFHIVAFYGQDEYLRAFTFNDRWSRISPLMLGVNTLQELFKYVEYDSVVEIDRKKLDIVLPFDVEQCIVSPMPMNRGIPPRFKTMTFYKGD